MKVINIADNRVPIGTIWEVADQSYEFGGIRRRRVINTSIESTEPGLVPVQFAVSFCEEAFLTLNLQGLLKVLSGNFGFNFPLDCFWRAETENSVESNKIIVPRMENNDL